MELAHTEEHIRNYFAPPVWRETSATRSIIRLPSPPTSSTGSNTATTAAESLQQTTLTPPATEDDDRGSYNEENVTFQDSPIQMEFERDFPPLQTPTSTTPRDEFSGSPHQRVSGLDMDLMVALAAKKDEIEIKTPVWPVTLTHVMGCGELAIGNYFEICGLTCGC